MEYVPGLAITDYCDTNQLGLRDGLLLFQQVCRAVEHAHEKGIIHRDLKPSNILVTKIDGVAVAKVIDFGVAKQFFEGVLAAHRATADAAGVDGKSGDFGYIRKFGVNGEIAPALQNTTSEHNADARLAASHFSLSKANSRSLTVSAWASNRRAALTESR